MKPLVEAVVADATGTMKATFFNQPWLERKYRPGTRLLLQGKYQARNRFRVSFHAPTGEAVGASDGEMATYPATDGLSLDADPRARPRAPRRRAGDARAAARPAARRSSGCPTAPPRSTPPTSATTRAAAAGSRSRSCCCSRSRCCAAAPAAARARAPSRSSRPAS